MDIEFLSACGAVTHAKQIKTRVEAYTWAVAELLALFKKWAATPKSDEASFEFLTNGRLGPSGLELAKGLEHAWNDDLRLLDCLVERNSGLSCLLGLRVRIRTDRSTIGELLGRAEREVAAMFTSPSTVGSALEQAEAAVNRLFRVLFCRAGLPNPEDRIIDRREIACFLGVPEDQRAFERWPGHLRSAYIEACLRLQPAANDLHAGLTPVPAEVKSDGAGDTALSPLVLTEGPSSKVLAGQTGIGKTIAIDQLRTAAAESNRVVVVLSAEAYVPGRLPALVADGLGDVVGRMLPPSTGRQLLADPSVTVVVDNISETPGSIRRELAGEIRPLVMSRQAATFVLVGRDVVALRELLPVSAQPTTYAVVPLSRAKRKNMVEDWIADQDMTEETHVVMARVERLLGSAVENPLLFTMALRLSAADPPAATRAELYEQTVDSLAVRSGTAMVSYVSRALGLVFAVLLNEERRYADPYRWATLLAWAVAEMGNHDREGLARRLDRAARRAGLVVPVGPRQRLAPIHDSFADYLAGTAHADGFPLPSRLRQGDRQRIMFACELAGVGAEAAMLITRDLPFVAPAVATLEARTLDQDSPTEIAEMLTLLSASQQQRGVLLCELADGRVAATASRSTSSWVSYAVLVEAAKTVGHIVCTPRGPLDVAVRLWRLSLRTSLRKVVPGLGGRFPANIAEAVSSLRAHAEETAQAVRTLVADIAPSGHGDHLGTLLGPLGITALVYPQTEDIFGPRWPVRYHMSDKTEVRPASPESPEPPHGVVEYARRGTVEHMTDSAPPVAAVEKIIRCINEEAVGSYWLRL